MTETNANERMLLQIKSIHHNAGAELAYNAINWLIEQAERCEELEGNERQISLLKRLINLNLKPEVQWLESENKKLQDKLNYVKSLVESNRIGHAIKFDLQMMFRDEDQ